MWNLKAAIASAQLVSWQVRYWRERRKDGPEVRFWRAELRKAVSGH